MIDLTKITPKELRNFIENNKRAGKDAAAEEALRELERRGLATRRDYRHIVWNQDKVRDVLRPFKEVSESVKNNQRTAYTEAGGKKIGRPKDDPDRRWIDSYSAIKTEKINAVFVCFVNRPGDEPDFELHVDGVCAKSFTSIQLDEALVQWRDIAVKAT